MAATRQVGFNTAALLGLAFAFAFAGILSSG